MTIAVAGFGLTVLVTVAGAIWHLRSYVDSKVGAHEGGGDHTSVTAAVDGLRQTLVNHGERLARIEEGVRHIESRLGDTPHLRR